MRRGTSLTTATRNAETLMLALVPLPDDPPLYRIALLDGTAVLTLRDHALALRCIDWLLSLPIDWSAGLGAAERQLLEQPAVAGQVARLVGFVQGR